MIVIVGIWEELDFRKMVAMTQGDSNPHNRKVVRFWVWCVYQFHHLGITDIIDEISILVKTQTIKIIPESSSKFLKISPQNPTKSKFGSQLWLKLAFKYTLILKLFQ